MSRGGGGFTAADVDVIFSSIKPRGGRRLTFDNFVNALAVVAERQGSTFEAVVRAVLASGGPAATNATAPAHVRLHDDKSTYTGNRVTIGNTGVLVLRVRCLVVVLRGCRKAWQSWWMALVASPLHDKHAAAAVARYEFNPPSVENHTFESLA